jgi:uncharacterized iron-regulated membrane protein
MSFLSTFLHHPRKLWLRRALFQVHLWAGVLLSLYLVVIALTGSVLVFRSELEKAQLPKTFSHYDAQSTVSIERIVDGFRVAYAGAKLDNLQTPSPQSPVFVLTASDANRHPFTVLADSASIHFWRQPRTWLDWIYDLHVYLLLGKTHGMQVNGIGATVLLLLTVTGIYLWWPGLRIWTRGLRFGLRHNWRRITFDMHNAIGFWTLFIVSWWALSGIYFAWYRPVTAAIAMVSPLKGMLSPAAPFAPASGPDRASLHQVLDAIHRTSPGGQLFSLSDPQLGGSTIYALVDRGAPGDFSHRDILTLSTTDAHILTIWHYGQNHSAGDWVLWAMHPLHFGTLWGMPVKILWALCGVALAVLTATGLLMYWNRYLRHKFRN